MKLFHGLTIIILCAVLPFTSCTDSKKDERAKEARETLPVAPTTTTTPTSNSPLLNPSTAVTNNEPHYKCADNCVGGVGAGAGDCPVCGKAMIHNQAYHNQTNNATPTTPTTTTTPTPTTPTPKAAEPAQNAAGVWHYTCAKGCAGGGAGAGTCAVCGGALAHNADYHN